MKKKTEFGVGIGIAIEERAKRFGHERFDRTSAILTKLEIIYKLSGDDFDSDNDADTDEKLDK